MDEGSPPVNPPTMFALRDASWYSRPDTSDSRPKVYHAAGRWLARCSGAPLAEFTRVAADELRPEEVCGRAACQKAYREAIA